MACPPGHIQVRRDYLENWTKNGLNPVLKAGEFAYVLDGPTGPIGIPEGYIGATGPIGSTGPIGNPLELNGGGASNSYVYGPVLNCGTSS
jgi:hypothetical protein